MTAALIFEPYAPSCVFAPSLPSILADRLGSHPRSCRELQELASPDEPLVRQALANHAVNKAIQPFRGVPCDVPRIQPKREFVNVAVKVFRAGVMIDTMQAPFQDRPNALNTVRADRPSSELAKTVVDRVVLKEQAVKIVVGPVLISEQNRTGFNRAVDLILDGVDIRSGYDHCDGTSTFTALTHPEHCGFTNRTTPRVQLLALVLVALFSADESFVNLNEAAKLSHLAVACFAESAQHEPCRLLSDADLFRQLHRTDALAGSDKQIHGIDPLVEWNMRPLKDRPSTDGEIELTGIAAVKASGLADGDMVPSFARWTDSPSRPKTAFQVFPRRSFIGEEFEKLKGANCASAHDPLYFTPSPDSRENGRESCI